MLQLEDMAVPAQTGWLEHLIESFPDEAESFDLSGYANGGVCIFLSALPSFKWLPARPQIAGILRRLGEQVVAGALSPPEELIPFLAHIGSPRRADRAKGPARRLSLANNLSS